MPILFDKPRSMNPEVIVRDMRSSPHCNGLEVLLWDAEITVEDRKTGEELSIKVNPAQLEVPDAKKDLAERAAKALVGAGLRRRPPPGSGKQKKPFIPRPPRT
mgnify:CR=1 FL=1